MPCCARQRAIIKKTADHATQSSAWIFNAIPINRTTLSLCCKHMKRWLRVTCNSCGSRHTKQMSKTFSKQRKILSRLLAMRSRWYFFTRETIKACSDMQITADKSLHCVAYAYKCRPRVECIGTARLDNEMSAGNLAIRWPCLMMRVL